MSKKMMYGVIIFLTLTSCGFKKNDVQAPLIFLHYWSDELSGGIDSMIIKFNDINPTCKIRATGFDHESYKISMKVMLSSGNPPDIFSYWAGARTASLVEKNYLFPMNDIWEKDNIQSKFPPSIVKACTYNNDIYILPVTQHYVAFFYNKKIFNNLQINPPQNWNQFLSICKKLKQNDIPPIALGSNSKWPAQFWFDYLLLRTAGQEYREKLMNSKASYNDKEVLNCFDMWSNLLNKEYFNSNPERYEWSDAAKMVADEKAGMTLMGTWLTGYFDNQLQKKQEIDYDYFSFPIVDSNIPQSALGPIDAILLPKTSNINKAETVISLFADSDVQKAMSVGSGALSPSIEVLPNSSTPIQNRINQELKTIPNWAFNYDLATPPEIAELGLQLFENFLKKPADYKNQLENITKEIKSISMKQTDDDAI